MDVRIGVGKSDQGTEHIVAIVQPQLETLSQALAGDHGGTMNHLWIDLELSPGDSDRRLSWPFQFQRKVVPPRALAASNSATFHNVGHFSVRPDYFALAKVPTENVSCYLLSLIYDSTATLAAQRRKIGDFNAEQFRARFREVMESLGCS